MPKKRLEQRKKEFLQAIKRLQEACDAKETALIRDATIQRFEFTYELAWKMLQLLLAKKDIDVRNPHDTLKAALEQGIIENGSS